MPETITRLSLNDKPSELDFEDFISAHLLLGGYTLDRSIHEKVEGAGDLFEVDIVTHQYESKDDRRLIELKSKKWDIGDIFKVGGRIRYLGIDSGVFVVQQKIDEKKFATWQSSMTRMDVSLLFVGSRNPSDPKLDLSELYDYFKIDGQNIDAGMLEAVRFGFIAERCMRSRVSQIKKSKDTEGMEALWDFSNAIQDISFYDSDPIQRLHQTFDLFLKYNHLSARLDYEFIHGYFPKTDEVNQFEGGRVKNYLLYSEKYLPVNYSFYLEHRLRMYIIQSCVEYLVMPKEYQNEMNSFLKRLSYNALSNNITKGIEFLGNNCKSYRKYPRLWQLFTYLMGGFILTDHYDEEMEILANLTEIDKDEVEICLSVYDILFPTTNNNWIREISYTHIKWLNFMSIPFMGIGANFRRYYYRDDKSNEDPSYEDLKKKLSKDYTFPNLNKWNQAAFDLLMISDDLKKS